MKVISIGDLVTDYYYKDDSLTGVDGGMTAHNIIANLSNYMNTKVYGVCGNDEAGKISIMSLEDLKVDVSSIVIDSSIDTRCFHISFFLNENGEITFNSKKRCPKCNDKRWYECSKINTNNIVKDISFDDILIFDNLNEINSEIINSTLNRKMLDLGQYFEFEAIDDTTLLNKIKNKFDIININKRVVEYFMNRFQMNDILDLYNLFQSKMIIVTEGKNGASFIYDSNIYHKDLKNISVEIDPNGAGDAFFATIIRFYINNNFNITNEMIDNAFLEATKLTAKVVKNVGARGHLHSLYEIKKKNDECTCKNFELEKVIKK